MKKGILKSRASLPEWAKPRPLVISREPEFIEAPEKPKVSPLPWRRQLAGWPDEWREKWGHRANALEDQGFAWRDAEQRAFVETLKAKREHENAPAVIEVKPRGTTRTLFKESA